MMICILDMRGRLRRNGHTYVSRCKVWKLNQEEVKRVLEARVLSKSVGKESERVAMGKV